MQAARTVFWNQARLLKISADFRWDSAILAVIWALLPTQKERENRFSHYPEAAPRRPAEFVPNLQSNTLYFSVLPRLCLLRRKYWCAQCRSSIRLLAFQPGTRGRRQQKLVILSAFKIGSGPILDWLDAHGCNRSRPATVSKGLCLSKWKRNMSNRSWISNYVHRFFNFH